MSENKYYDGTKLLSMKDINGLKPELFLCTTNRSGGKTTYFGRLEVNRFLKYGKKFCLIDTIMNLMMYQINSSRIYKLYSLEIILWKVSVVQVVSIIVCF